MTCAESVRAASALGWARCELRTSRDARAASLGPRRALRREEGPEHSPAGLSVDLLGTSWCDNSIWPCRSCRRLLTGVRGVFCNNHSRCSGPKFLGDSRDVNAGVFECRGRQVLWERAVLGSRPARAAPCVGSPEAAPRTLGARRLELLGQVGSSWARGFEVPRL